MKQVYNTADGQTLWRSQNSMVMNFAEVRNIAGSSVLNGGIQPGIDSIFNHTMPKAIKTAEDMPGGGVARYMEITARQLGLDPKTSAGLLTSARMTNAALKTICFRGLEVRVVITAGIDINGVRIGDPSSYYEQEGQFICPSGTINILLTINANLPPETLLKSVITATEAKTAALQELLAPSKYSFGLATGSGTDGIIVAADPASPHTLTDAGGHSLLGELIGRAVTAGVKKALELETGLSPQRQMNVLERVIRFGIDIDYFLQRAAASYPSLATSDEFRTGLLKLFNQPQLVALASAVIHLQDQVYWRLLPENTAFCAAQCILQTSDMPKIRPGEVPTRALIDLLVDWLNNTAYRELKHPL